MTDQPSPFDPRSWGSASGPSQPPHAPVPGIPLPPRPAPTSRLPKALTRVRKQAPKAADAAYGFAAPTALPDAPTRRPSTRRAGHLLGGARGRMPGLPTRGMRHLVVALVLGLGCGYGVLTWVAQPYRVPSSSMYPTLREGDHIVTEKLGYVLGEPRRGQVIVFDADHGFTHHLPSPHRAPSRRPGGRHAAHQTTRHPHATHNAARRGAAGSEVDYVKRIIAVGGDVVMCCDHQGRVKVNGSPLLEPYLESRRSTDAFGPVKVPHGELFVMGDNRANSQDSRTLGTLRLSAVRGHVIVRAWPFARMGRVATQ